MTTLLYLGATLAQITTLTRLLWLMDLAFDSLDVAALPQGVITAIVCVFFAFVTLRSRLFSMLDNTRTGSRYTSLRRPGGAPLPFRDQMLERQPQQLALIQERSWRLSDRWSHGDEWPQ